MRVVDAPTNSGVNWFFKIESSGAASAVELPLTDGGPAPVTGEWATYEFSLQSLFDAGLDISDINVLMVFPTWGPSWSMALLANLLIQISVVIWIVALVRWLMGK